MTTGQSSGQAPTVSGPRADAGAVSMPAAPSRPSTPGVTRLVIAVSSLVALVGLLLVLPLLAAVLSMALFVAFVPIVEGLSGRLVAGLCLIIGLVGAATVALAVIDASFGLQAARALGVVPGLVAGVYIAVRRGSWEALLPRWDSGLLPFLLTAVASWLVTGATLVGRPPAAVMGGLSALGWDHQSHFSMFLDVHRTGGVWQASSGLPRPSFDAYPPLAAMLASWGSWLFDGQMVASASLVTRYAQSAAVLCAIALGLLAWVAAALAERLLPTVKGAWPAALVGIVVGGYLFLGPLLSFFDYGFTNFLLAGAVAAAVSYLVLDPLSASPGRGGLLLAAGVVATSLLWTPLLFLLFPTGVLLCWRLARRRAWLLALLGVAPVALSLLAPLWQTRRIAPDASSAHGLTQTIGAVAGGLPPVPLGQAAALVVGGLTFSFLAPRGGRRPWLAALAVAAGALLLVAGFAAVSLHTGTHPQHSYYASKAGWVLYIVAVPLLGGVLARCLTWLPRATAVRGGRSERASGWAVAGASVAAVAMLWATLGYSNTAGSRTGYVAVPPTADSVMARWSAFRHVDAGFLVFAASDAIGPDRQRVPIIWDGGDLKQNRWLASLRMQLDGVADGVYNPMPGGPYLQPAVDALRTSLRGDPDLAVTIAYFRPESEELLQPLVGEFPVRVRLVRMG